MLHIDFATFPVLSTQGLVLRQLAISDAPIIHQLRSDPDINRYVGRAPSTGIEAAESFVKMIQGLVAKQQSLYWAITLNGDDTLIGTVCLWNFDVANGVVEVGYELTTQNQGKGIMIEAVKEVVKYAFEQLEASIITAFPSADNLKSVALLDKLNFKIDGALTTKIQAEVPGMLGYSLERTY